MVLFNVKIVGLWLGPVLAVGVLLLADLTPGNPTTTRMAAVALWMAAWWITEAVPLAVTALLPVVLYPLLGIMAGKAVAPLYFNSIIFLFLGGFMVALAMERWGLHKRIALRIIQFVGGGARGLVFGFMAAAAFLSMWISNTATTMMMIPIAMAVIAKAGEWRTKAETTRFAVALLLGTAYGASIGGTATLVGTPPNPMLVKNLSVLFPEAPEISFAQWFVFAFPLAVVFLLLTWLVLAACLRLWKLAAPVPRAVFRKERENLGPLSFAEKVVLVDFLLLAILWMTRKGLTLGSWELPGWSCLLGRADFVDDGTVAIGVAMLLFLVPSCGEPDEGELAPEGGDPAGGGGDNTPARRLSPSRGRIMDWSTARNLPWGIVLLFGGGFALAQGFVDSGLAIWLGGLMEGLSHLPPLWIVLSVCLLLTFLTELTSNTATTQMALPILAAVAVAIQVNPLLLMVPATLSASCAFMLPVATPPNAIIFGTNRLRVGQMARVGIILNLIGAILITLCIYFMGRAVLGIVPGELPAWATQVG
jgi:sodium-dependent dicarboxylate transporter 2/3/5